MPSKVECGFMVIERFWKRKGKRRLTNVTVLDKTQQAKQLLSDMNKQSEREWERELIIAENN